MRQACPPATPTAAPCGASGSPDDARAKAAGVTAASYYSPRLNVVLEFVEGPSTVDEILTLKSIPVRMGHVNTQTRVLAFVQNEDPVQSDQLNSFGSRLMSELPEYSGTRTAVVTRHIAPATRVTVLAYDTATNQSIRAFFTLRAALSFLSLDQRDLLEAFPEARSLILKQMA